MGGHKDPVLPSLPHSPKKSVIIDALSLEVNETDKKATTGLYYAQPKKVTIININFMSFEKKHLVKGEMKSSQDCKYKLT